MSSREIPETKDKKRNELSLEDDQAALQLDASLISSFSSVKKDHRHGNGPKAEAEAEIENELELAAEDVDGDEEEDNLSLSDLTCSSSGAEEEADEDAFAIDEASLVGVMEPCRRPKVSVNGAEEPAAPDATTAAGNKDDLEKEQLEHIVSLCQIIRQRLANISAQLQRRTEELDQKILARQKERDSQQQRNRLHL